MADFDIACDFVIEREGELSEHPADPGGITKYGISYRFLKSLPVERLKQYGIYDLNEDTIRQLDIPTAKKIYHGEFWVHAPFEKIISQANANYIFDMVINMGISPAIKCAQRACWAVRKKWDDLKDDGILGTKTLAAINVCGFLLMPALRAERANYYRSLDKKEFINGWFNRAYRS